MPPALDQALHTAEYIPSVRSISIRSVKEIVSERSINSGFRGNYFAVGNSERGYDV